MIKLNTYENNSLFMHINLVQINFSFMKLQLSKKHVPRLKKKKNEVYKSCIMKKKKKTLSRCPIEANDTWQRKWLNNINSQEAKQIKQYFQYLLVSNTAK